LAVKGPASGGHAERCVEVVAIGELAWKCALDLVRKVASAAARGRAPESTERSTCAWTSHGPPASWKVVLKRLTGMITTCGRCSACLALEPPTGWNSSSLASSTGDPVTRKRHGVELADGFKVTGVTDLRLERAGERLGQDNPLGPCAGEEVDGRRVLSKSGGTARMLPAPGVAVPVASW